MPTLTDSFGCSSEVERLVLEQTVAYLTHLRQVAANAPSGAVLEACERVALGEGRDALRATLEAALQTRIRARDAAQKKSPARGPRGSAPGG